ncbi:hypothetical protein ROE7235_03376 [Roseibaca ekhonensis]|uniref:Uncharacterized protein n=3 Tax=Rhodobacterales TaxID=204455 RepID=A0A239KTV0_9RHOB|nr:hypothetical protein ROA7023_03662 [Roseisalinus antarcticus]SNT21450.1 hypothetical protein SAMN04488078_107116 [Antarctobacter heliothermus]SUZ33603.1 hypothetical protein ROE7235_03376 [Roseibaca ekhonensis]
MTYNAGCWKRRLVVLVIATIWLTGCVGVGFENGSAAACPPTVEYSQEFQVRTAEELALMPDGLAVIEMMGDYGVMREQAAACR